MIQIICFHNLGEENEYLSNWYSSDFTVDNIRFCSVEQYMMYQKAVIFNDEDTADKIMNETEPSAIKKYGREISGYDDIIWNGIRQLVVYKGLLAKFSQNEFLKAKLKATGNAILAECAVRDKIWGNGVSMDDPDRYDLSKWKGTNLLGFSLMQVRAEL